MNESKHTPGPWYATPDPDRDTWWVSQQPEGGTFWIAEAVNGLMNDETEPNAHLIAAAPDLLEACEAIVRQFEEFRELNPIAIASAGVYQCRRAIDKAKGKP